MSDRHISRLPATYAIAITGSVPPSSSSRGRNVTDPKTNNNGTDSGTDSGSGSGHKNMFDVWNSSSTGHQRSESTSGTAWRDSRNNKLRSQFASATAAARVPDSTGRGAADWDEKLGGLVSREVRARAGLDVRDMLVRPGSMRRQMMGDVAAPAPNNNTITTTTTTNSNNNTTSGSTSTLSTTANYGQISKEQAYPPRAPTTTTTAPATGTGSRRGRRGGVFNGLVIYVNGSTLPLISDHRLKQVLAENGARMSLHLGRRQVTHVVLGRPSAVGSGAGGGLAAGKLEREIRRIGGCGVKYVGVEWVLESLKAGRRLPEARFANLKMASHGQDSVYGLFNKPF